MTTCANCANEAFFEYLVTASSKIPFCKKHIPGFAKSGTYAARILKIEKSASVEAAKSSKKKAVVEETPAVEEVLEEAPLEEPTTEVTEAE